MREFVNEVIELFVLLQRVHRRRAGGLLLECEVHSLMAVLLWMSRLDALDLNAEPEPPHRQLRQIEQSLGLANGTPLSERIASGSPRSANNRSKAVNAPLHDAALPKSTEAERLIIQRIGQDIFRAALMDYWTGNRGFWRRRH
jgi:hypothetical protein